MNPISHDSSAVNHSNGQESGIRASFINSDDLRPTSTMMPCKHCSDEKKERRWLQRRCYYCNKPGHQISTCMLKENDEETQLLRLAIDTGTQQQHNTDSDHQNDQRMEYIVVGTDGGFWSDMWGRRSHVWVRKDSCIQSVLYTLDIDRNVLSLDQLIIQGFTVKFNGDKCKLFPTFSVPLINKISNITRMTKEDEVGMLEKQSVMSRETDHEKFKTEFLNDYFESLNMSTNEPDWNVLILQATPFKEFRDCKALLDMLDDEDYEINTRPLPAYAPNNRKVCLLDLYMAVKREGGHRRITKNNMWAMIARDIGFEYDEGEYMRLIYAMYLDVLIYYYKYKSTQEKVLEKEEVKMVVDPRQSRSEGNRVVGTDADQTEGNSRSAEVAGKDAEHYAFFPGNDWQGIKRLNTRRRFDFNRAKVAVDDANNSVLKHSRKRNYV
ncbi:putative transcription factor interactor and regulator CCHC(Zn) family [Helianthus annuus]|nr:putative transcription factor interactor and regulator CCHC(Zn) family [Helianthus annuus]